MIGSQRKQEESWRPYVGAPEEHSELIVFDRDYRIERFSHRDVMLQLGGALWFFMAVVALLAGQLDDTVETSLQTELRFGVAAASLAIGVSMLTWVRKLDDERAAMTVTIVTVFAMISLFVFSFYGPGALGAMVVGQIASIIYCAQFLGARAITAILVLTSILAGLGVYFNYNDPDSPSFLSQTVLLVIVLWAVGYSIYVITKDRAEALDEAERTAFTDSLTQLPNTRMLRRRAEALLDTRNERLNRQVGVIILDLDGFRSANMLNGRRDGDRLLVAAADGMRETSTEGEFVARTGSDEFTVLSNNAEHESLAARGDSYRQAVLRSIDQHSGIGVNIDASVGVAISGAECASFENLVRSADRSLYLVKAEHERMVPSRRSPLDVEREESAWLPTETPRRAGSQRRDRLRWRNRPTEVKFVAVSWLLSSIAVAASLAMPDAVTSSTTAIPLLVVFGVMVGTIQYCREAAQSFSRQFFDVLLASTALGVTVYLTGATTSPALPIGMLILIYIGWFMPLRVGPPVGFLAIVIVISPYAFAPDAPLLLLDAVTIVGGVMIAGALLALLYYNHYSLERAKTLTAQLASLDPRAGSYNRRAFEERMRVELDHLSYGDRDALAVVMVDLGNFKSVSANHGRVVADELLTEVAGALTAASREDDFVARLGGDEFGIVAPGVNAESARALAQRLVESVRDALEDFDLQSDAGVRPSAGFSLYGMHGRTADELVTAADVALTTAKTSGRDPNRVSSFVVAL